MKLKCQCCLGKGFYYSLSKVIIFKPKHEKELPAKIDIVKNTIEFDEQLFISKKAFIMYLNNMDDCGKWLDYFYNIHIDNSDTYVNNVFYNINERYGIEFK